MFWGVWESDFGERNRDEEKTQKRFNNACGKQQAIYQKRNLVILFSFFLFFSNKCVHAVVAQIFLGVAVESLALTLERRHDVDRGDGLAVGVLGVGGGALDDLLDEVAEDTADLLVQETRDALDSATAGEALDGALRDTVGVVLEDLLDDTLGRRALGSDTGLGSLGHLS